MNKFQAIDAFWNSFSIPAYDSNTVPDDASYPYITYEASTASFDELVPLTASLWYRDTSWEGISVKAQEIEDFIGGGTGVLYDNGRLWITKESPFAQRLSEPNDGLVRLVVLQITVEFQ